MDSAAVFTSGAASHELDFASALQAAEAIRKKQVSSVKLARHVFERIAFADLLAKEIGGFAPPPGYGN